MRQTTSNARGSILVVDDDEKLRDLLSRYLERMFPFARVRIAADAETALDIMERARVDLVIADYRLPGQNGLDFLAYLRGHYPATRRILFTGDPDAGLARAADRDAHTELFFVKPLALANVAHAVESILKKSLAPSVG